ncbi:hypothetical protein FAZ98_00990 [Paraburkholderia acidisoli]|uniref:Uncharacterized protein n=1 Tax=Paraburkholderia acidisoli TaxID=2571748 RepID=A0A7Z2GER2_9BURK|nr:hypothetical protein FAZ98_00990 [Paraburkholderia acidisoli]
MRFSLALVVIRPRGRLRRSYRAVRTIKLPVPHVTRPPYRRNQRDETSATKASDKRATNESNKRQRRTPATSSG